MKIKSKIVEYNFEASAFNWEIAPGKTVEAWGFNKQLPGPVLRANVGDTLIVRLMNNLNEPTTIHWHGICLPAAMDGIDGVQEPVAPGETFKYRFVVPDAGTFWYYSHANEFTKPGWFIPRVVERHDGRQGNTLLLNGKENTIVNVNGSQTERWRFINSSSVRYFLLHLERKSLK